MGSGLRLEKPGTGLIRRFFEKDCREGDRTAEDGFPRINRRKRERVSRFYGKITFQKQGSLDGIDPVLQPHGASRRMTCLSYCGQGFLDTAERVELLSGCTSFSLGGNKIIGCKKMSL